MFDFVTKIGVTYFRFPSPAHQKAQPHWLSFFRACVCPPCLRYPIPKSLPSGKGLTSATDENCAGQRNRRIFVTPVSS